VTGSISGYAQYDIAGNVVKSIDGRGNTTTISYADCFGSPDGNATSNIAPTELTTPSQQTSYGFPTRINRSGQITYSQFDYYTGKPVDGQSVNGVVASGWYEDPFDRPTKVIADYNNLAAKSQKLFAYDDANHKITTISDFDAFNDQQLKTESYYDGLGRATETRQYEGGSNYIVVQQNYDVLGRAYKSSNPFRPWKGESAIWTQSAFDALGRVTSVTTPDGSVMHTGYTGNSVTVTDQDTTGKSRKSVTDALGRLTDVYEDPTGLKLSDFLCL